MHDDPGPLMDEPFAALDEFARHRLQADLLGLWRDAGCTVVFVTHSIYEAAFLAHRIVLMMQRPGRIAKEITSPLDAENRNRLDPGYSRLVRDITEAIERVLAAQVGAGAVRCGRFGIVEGGAEAHACATVCMVQDAGKHCGCCGCCRGFQAALALVVAVVAEFVAGSGDQWTPAGASAAAGMVVMQPSSGCLFHNKLGLWKRNRASIGLTDRSLII